MTNKDKIRLIELNLYAEGAYSGATHEEIMIITPQDYIKYLGVDQDNTDNFEESVEEDWEDVQICVGDLDGKHSEVFGDVEVVFWKESEIAEYFEDDDTYNTNGYLMDKFIDRADDSLGEGPTGIRDNIAKHAKEVINTIGTKVTVSCKVPKDKVAELEAFVEKLNRKE